LSEFAEYTKYPRKRGNIAQGKILLSRFGLIDETKAFILASR